VKQHPIILKKVNVHNLKSVDLTLAPNELIVFSGVSGSGKSSLAFDTLYVEGQRRYVESLSMYARRQLGELSKPDLESAEGITPTISIEQKSASRNPRSTVGTLTEIYDYLRVLYARVGVPHCPVSGEAVQPQSRERIIRTVQTYPEGSEWVILAPLAKGKKGEFKEDFQELLRKGFTRVRVDGRLLRLDEGIALDRNLTHDIDVVFDRVKIHSENQSRIAESVTAALQFSNGLISVLNPDTEEESFFSMHAFSPKSGLSYDSLEPHDFSFNSPQGYCPTCLGLGIVQEFDLDLVIDPDKSIAEDCCSVASSFSTVRFGNIYNNLAAIYGFSVHTPWKKLSAQARRIFLYGTEKKWTRMRFVHPVTGAVWMDHVQWRGVLHEAKARFADATSEGYRNKMLKLMRQQVCPDCQGERLKPYPRAALLGEKRIGQLSSMTVEDILAFFNQLTLPPQDQKIAQELLKEIKERLKFLIDVGLNYLTLDRTAPTLAGGEAQRVRLASQIGCGLVGITYILDEPSIGLHPRDNRKLLHTLKSLRDIGNTVIVVEHDEETMVAADRIVDFGPGAGSKGGQILVNGTLEDLIGTPDSLTADYLIGRKTIAIPSKRRKKTKAALKILGAKHHNLKNLDVTIPLGLFVSVTGVSGSGKSSLIGDILYPALSNELHRSDLEVGAHQTIKGISQIDKIISIDQTPIGRNPRSNPATYIKLFDDIRALFATVPESRARGYLPGRFSFNVKEGSCPECRGMGMIQIDMDFLEEEWVECPLCHNKRFDEETLAIHYKGKNIFDILEMDVGTALEFFSAIPSIRHKLEMLQKVGLDYLKLGQSSTTLSGGEAQRIKLAKELVRPATGHTLYLLDEPTTGLHFHDIRALLGVLHDLVDRGNSVLVIEHNMDIVKTADWVIDLGPSGGMAGGRLIAEGTPELLASLDTPTGHALREVLNLKPQQRLEILRTQSVLRPDKEPIASITVSDAEQNNLKRFTVSIPREKITVCTGPSGSGKSSLAFETVYAEGQRRYIESLSPYARQFVTQMPKPKAGYVEGLSPAIAIEQKAHAGNPRSTVGTMTEIYDYVRLLYARLGIPHDPETGEEIRAISKEHVLEKVLELPLETKFQILALIEIRKQDSFEAILERLRKQGFVRIRLNDTYHSLDDPLEELPYDRKRKNALYLVIDRLKVDPSIKWRLLESIQQAAQIGKNKILIALDGQDLFFNLAFGVASSGKSYPEITSQTFAFNKPEGYCLECLGLGFTYGANLLQKQWILELTLAKLLKVLMKDPYPFVTTWLYPWFEKQGIDPYAPLRLSTPKALNLLMNGSSEEIEIPHSQIRLRWQGLNSTLAQIGKMAASEYKDAIVPLLDEQPCASCKGERLNSLARAVTLQGLSIGQFCTLPVDQALAFVQSIPIQSEQKVLEEVRNAIVNRLNFMCEIGIHYLSLSRGAPTLSGGETQRIRLSRQLGSGLTGVLYVLDEPTIGLHPQDNAKLNGALAKLKGLGNTLLMVEHDPLTVQAADRILDFGPGAGIHGGHLVAQGTYQEILKNPHSLTGEYLSGRKKIPVPHKRRKPKQGYITIQGAHQNNLKDLDLKIPVGLLTCITGVSGSGKSTLLYDVIGKAVERSAWKEDRCSIDATKIAGLSHFNRLISIDQNPVGHTIRSDIATYVEVLGPIREFFAQLPMAKTRGLQPKHFSYNHLRGMCTNCWGLGFKRVEMHFLPSIRIPCDECHGLRLNPLSLQVTYQGKNLGQLLQCTIEEVREIFRDHPRICRILDTLISVGLGYLQLGQETQSLSGGEAQRIKLSRELAKRSTGQTLYLLDEPTTGLHSVDIAKLLPVLHHLADKGNTLIMVEHQLDMIRNADFIIDLGPEAGQAGGYLVASGTPEEVAENPTSATGYYLRQTTTGFPV
jgi:excinuclease ABC subunit A